MKQTAAERQQAFREAKRKAGMKEVRNLWCFPRDEVLIKRFAERLNRKRTKSK